LPRLIHIKAFGSQDLLSPIERRPDHLGVEHRLDASVLERFLDHHEMSAPLLGESEQGHEFPFERGRDAVGDAQPFGDRDAGQPAMVWPADQCRSTDGTVKHARFRVANIETQNAYRDAKGLRDENVAPASAPAP
jgi:hypothetical protein